MRKITKGLEPPELTKWKRQNVSRLYTNLSHIERQAINQATRAEQFGLCAYCCKQINASNSINEHIEARATAPNRQLDFKNIVASCDTRGRCDAAHGSQALPLTPLMAECETELRFRESGKVEGKTPRAIETIRVLGLDTRAIRAERKQMIDTLILPENFNDLQSIDDELLKELLDDLQQPKYGQLQAYSPVLINILKQFLKLA